MFRKPKKNKSSLFRKRKKRTINDDDDDDDDDDNDDNGNQNTKNTNNSNNKRKFRKRSSSSSDDDDNNKNYNNNNNKNNIDPGEETSTFLEQYKNETKKKGRKGIHNNNHTKDNEKSSSFMHEYNSTQKRMTQQELATLQSDYATANTTNTNKQETSDSTPKRNKFLAGPLKASKFIRTTTRFDYEPNICKDFKETGFCGFGDSCIYLHDRTNMKSGMVLEQEWEERKRKEKEKKEKEMDFFMNTTCTVINENGSGGGDGGKNVMMEEDGIPFACHSCRDSFKEPIVTVCNHYFCQQCILKQVRDENNPACPICNQDTNGVFNYPTKLISKKRRIVGRNGTWDEYKDFMAGKK